MTFEILNKQPIKFYKHDGMKFFEPFRAVDNKKQPLNIEWHFRHNSKSIVAKNRYSDDISIYDIELSKDEFKGVSLVANPEKRGIGEVLNLASLISFKENLAPYFNVFSLRNSIAFFAKYGFNIFSENPNEVIHNLKFLSKIKGDRFEDTRDSAQYFLGKLNADIDERYKAKTRLLGNNLVSDFIRNMVRENKKIDTDDLYSHTHMQFSSLDMLRNADYLNELLEKHEINYKI